MRKLLFLFVLAVLGCTGKPDQTHSKEDVVTEMSLLPAAIGGAEQQVIQSPPTDRKIIRNATLDFRVKKAADSSKKINDLVTKNGARVTSTTESRSSDRLYVRMNIQVPEAKLDTFLASMLEESIYTENKNIESEDVTKQFIDTEARIRSKKATEEKYLDLLKKARNVEEVLKVEEQLRIIREEIEVKEAEFKELKENIALSRVYANFYEELTPGENPGKSYLEDLADNFIMGFSLVRDLSVGLVRILPALVILIGIIWLVKKWKKKQS